MTLEDHSGDILRKARNAAGISLETLAGMAGLTPDQFAQLEETGHIPHNFPYEHISARLELDARKLQEISRSWTPSPQALDSWKHLMLIPSSQGGNSVNAHLVWDESTHEAGLFDTGWTADAILPMLKQESLVLKHIFITHSHQDHIAGIPQLMALYPEVLVHRGANPSIVNIGSLQVSTHSVPGHATDGVIYRIDHWPKNPPGVAFLGDTLFAGSLARGFISTQALKKAVALEVFSLPGNTLLCPGHGPVTTVDEEKNHNPFFTHRQ